MYFGSVRFFKHLILAIIALLIFIPTASCVHLAIKCYALQGQLSQLQLQLSEQENGLPERGDGLAGQENDPAKQQDESKISDAVDKVYASDNSSLAVTGGPAYQAKYPHLYVSNPFNYVEDDDNTVYLTFDDGPSSLTPKVLDILKLYDVPATFFVVYQSGHDAGEMYRRIVDEGHTLAIHTATHNYKKIYESVEAYLDDFAVLSDALEKETGVRPEIFRFPGGSINNYNKQIHNELVSEMLRRGYTYYDWDVSSGSSTKTANESSIYSNVMNGVSGKNRAIVLMHDAGTYATVDALPRIIESLKASGYQFGALNKTIKPTCFDYLN